jgi:RNA polymerase sigma-70 factor (ECF subfamily)
VPAVDATAELVVRVQRGEAKAFEGLVRRYLRPAYLVALAIVGRPADAEDIAQEALILAFERLETCRNPEAFRSWLFQIVRNHSLNWLDRRRLRDVSRDPTPKELPHDGPAPDAHAFRAQLLAALNELGPSEREVVLLHDLEGWTHPEISAALGISAVMSRQSLFQARRKLRAGLSSPPAREEIDHE